MAGAGSVVIDAACWVVGPRMSQCARSAGSVSSAGLLAVNKIEHARVYQWPLYCVECRRPLPADYDDSLCPECVARFRKTWVDCGESVNREHKRCRACHEVRQERIAKWQEAKDLERRADRLEEMAKRNGDQVEGMRQRRNAAGLRE